MYQHYYTNNLKDRLPLEAEKSWRGNLSSSLLQYFDYTEEYADICIVLGKENMIFCHRLILSLNSSIMSDCEPWKDSVKKECGSAHEKVYSIKLLPEFDEHPHIMRSIIRSLYCGEISVGYENIKVVYKFAKCYQVKWLTSYAQSMFGEILEAENFVDLFAFAEKFGKQNNKLILVCLSRLDSKFLKKLYSLETGNIFAFNYYSLKSITSSDKTLLSAIEIFRLIADWAEDELENRRCHIEILLFDIKYHRISKSDLVDFVYPWVMHTKGIEDSLRTSLMKLITKRIVESNQKEDFFQKGNLGLGITTMKVDKLLEDIMRDMETKATSGEYSLLHTDTLSAEEVFCVVKMRYPTADPLVKQCIIEYINDHKIIDNATVTDFMKLYEDNKEEDLRYVILKFLNGKSSDQAMKSVQWDVFPFEVVQEFIKGAVLGKMEYVRIECIMQWSEGVHFDEEKLDELLSNLVCYYRIPEDYISFVLKPFLKNIVPNRTFDLVCGVHEADSMDHCEEIVIQCVVKPLSKEFSLLSDTVQHITECKMWLQLQINATKPLQLLSKQKKINSDTDVYVTFDEENESYDVYMNCESDYLIFDLNKPLNSYPIHSNASPSLAELRELFASYKELHILVMWIPTDTGETSTDQAPTLPARSTAPPLPPRKGSSKSKVKGWKIWKKI